MTDINMRDLIDQRLRDSCALTSAILAGPIPDQLVAVAARAVAAYAAGGQLLLFGNGGSSADASHLAGELVGRFRRTRQALPAISLTDQLAALTAIGNDYGYDEVFARGIDAYGRPGDIAVALSTSGTSANVIRGLARARERGLWTVLFTGAPSLAEGVEVATADAVIRVPSADVPRVQEATMHLGHTLCELIEAAQL